MEKQIVLVALSKAERAANFVERLEKDGHEVHRAYAQDQIDLLSHKKSFTLVVVDAAWLAGGLSIVKRLRRSYMTSRMPITVVAESEVAVPSWVDAFKVSVQSYENLLKIPVLDLFSAAQRAASTWTPAAPSVPVTARHKLLIIEDNYDTVELLHDRLEMEGFFVDIAYDGVEGLNKIWKTEPDIVVLDIMMPKIDGIGVLKNLKDQGYFPRLPVIVSSAKSTADDVKTALSLGAVAYEVKPYRMSQLLATLKKHVKNGG